VADHTDNLSSPALGVRSLVAVAAGAFVALGLARFSYALVIPSMRSALRLSYTRAGLLGSANTAGYLLGSLLLRARPPRDARRAFRIGTAITATAIVLTGVSEAYGWLVSMRVISGFASANVFILGSTLAATLMAERPTAVAIFNAGPGLGVVFSALSAPLILSGHPERWRPVWFLLGGLALVALVIVATVELPRSAAGAATSTASADTQDHAAGDEPSLRWLLLSYGCFGTGYIVYVTYLGAVLADRRASSGVVMMTFALLGATAVAAPRMWRAILASRTAMERSRRSVMAMPMVVQAVGAGILIVSSHPISTALSAAVFGSAFLMSPTVTTLVVRASRSPQQWARVLGGITALFATGQAIAPWASGALIDHFGTVAAPTWTVGWSLLGVAFCKLA
jgi:predicted MFS family arabinose efflux permease